MEYGYAVHGYDHIFDQIGRIALRTDRIWHYSQCTNTTISINKNRRKENHCLHVLLVIRHRDQHVIDSQSKHQHAAIQDASVVPSRDGLEISSLDKATSSHGQIQDINVSPTHP